MSLKPNKNLDAYLKDLEDLGFERTQEMMRFKKIKEIISLLDLPNDKSIIEVGPGYKSIFTELLLKNPKIVIEPIEVLLERNRVLLQSVDQVKFYVTTIEKFRLDSAEKSCLIIMSSNLHEFIDTGKALKSCYKSLSKNGKILIVVPNQNSLHRILGVRLGLQKKINALTDTEKKMQQYRSYSISSLTEEVVRAGFEVESVETNFIKPLNHAQMKELQDRKILTAPHLEFLYRISPYLPGLGSEIFLVANKK